MSRLGVLTRSPLELVITSSDDNTLESLQALASKVSCSDSSPSGVRAENSLSSLHVPSSSPLVKLSASEQGQTLPFRLYP